MKVAYIFYLLVLFSPAVSAQTSFNRYEAEMLKNPNKGGKDTRQVNAVLVFEKEALKINSRRRNEVFKEFKYADIRYVEHSFSKNPFYSSAAKATILTILTGLPLFYDREEKHWLTVLTESDFVVLKIENDNFRLIKNEFVVRKLKVENINETFQ